MEEQHERSFNLCPSLLVGPREAKNKKQVFYIERVKWNFLSSFLVRNVYAKMLLLRAEEAEDPHHTINAAHLHCM